MSGLAKVMRIAQLRLKIFNTLQKTLNSFSPIDLTLNMMFCLVAISFVISGFAKITIYV